MKLSVPHIVPKAHFTHEVRFTCEAYFTFRASGTLSSKNAPLSVDKSAFFVVKVGRKRYLGEFSYGLELVRFLVICLALLGVILLAALVVILFANLLRELCSQ